MTYKGYTGVIEVDEESGELFGTVIGLRDVITFVGTTVEDARKQFEESVDYYLEHCQDSGKKPDTPFAGQFLVRVDSDTHRRLAILAAIHKLTLNDLVAKALKDFAASNDLGASDEIFASWTSDSVEHKRNQAAATKAAKRAAASGRRITKMAGKTG